MEYSLNDLTDLFNILIKELGLNIAIIGSVALYYNIGEKRFNEDLDLFIYKGSILEQEDRLREICYKKGWDFGLTEFGTPKITVRKDEYEIEIEIFENIYDFYIPQEIIERSRDIKIGDLIIKMILPEHYVVLKARTGSSKDIEKLSLIKDLVNERKLRLDLSIIRETISYFEDEEKMIISRLRSVGINI